LDGVLYVLDRFLNFLHGAAPARAAEVADALANILVIARKVVGEPIQLGRQPPAE
jgi:hypothetical protein